MRCKRNSVLEMQYGLSAQTLQKIRDTLDLSIFGNIRSPEMVAQIKRVGVVFYKKQDFSP